MASPETIMAFFEERGEGFLEADWARTQLREYAQAEANEGRIRTWAASACRRALDDLDASEAEKDASLAADLYRRAAEIARAAGR